MTAASRAPDARLAPVAAAPPSAERPLRRAVVVCDQWLGSNGYAGMKALRRAGWSVHVAPEWEYVPVRWRSAPMKVLARALRPFAVREFNARLVDLARRTDAEMLLVFKGTFVYASALRALRERGVRLYCFYPDVSFRVHGRWLPDALREYDWIFTTKSFGVRDLNDQLGVTRASVIRHAFDPDLHRPVRPTPADLERYGCDVSFIGTWSPKKERLLRALRARLPDVRLRIWGDQWRGAVSRSTGLEQNVEGRAVEGEEYVRAIVSSKINLAILSEHRPGASSGDRITSRTFHIPACGGFMLHERTDEVLDVLREPQEIACFADADEMIAQIERLLRDDATRAAIATRAHDRITAAHSWDHRIREIVNREESGS